MTKPKDDSSFSWETIIIILVIGYFIFGDGCSGDKEQKESTSSNTTISSQSPSKKTTAAGYTNTEKGEVIWVGKGCDFVIIEAGTWYTLAETYSGYLDTGDKVECKLNSYGFKDCKKNGYSDIRLYIENYHGTKERCFEWLESRGKCGF